MKLCLQSLSVVFNSGDGDGDGDGGGVGVVVQYCAIVYCSKIRYDELSCVERWRRCAVGSIMVN